MRWDGDYDDYKDDVDDIAEANQYFHEQWLEEMGILTSEDYQIWKDEENDRRQEY